MNIHHVLNIFDSYYGKKRKRIKLSVDGCHIYVRSIYDKDEAIVLRIWINRTPADMVHTIKDSFKLILWHDCIYTNDYIMPDAEKQKHFFDVLQSMTTCKADYMFKNYEIELDNGQIKELHAKNREEMLRDMSHITQYNVYSDNKKHDNDKFWWDSSVHSIIDEIYFEQYLTQLIKERNLTAA